MFDVYADFRQAIDTIYVENLKYNLGSQQGLQIGQIISDIIPIILGVSGFVTVIVIVISGIQFITSSGNPEAAGAARGRLIYAIIGFVVIIMSFAILQVVNALFLNSGVV